MTAVHRAPRRAPVPAVPAVLTVLTVLAALAGLGGCSVGTVPTAPADFTQPIRGSQVQFDLVWIADGGFWIGKTEVTWDEYLLYCDFEKTGKVPPGVDGVTKPSKPLDDVTPYDRDWGLGRRPAVGISRHAAVQYCKWLSQNTGRTYRLPTEAEWLLACGKPPAGPVEEFAWCAENSDEMTHEVGRKKPNEHGVHDMLGNLWEYCSNPFSAAEPDRAVLRGGAWDTAAANTSPASRLGFEGDWVLADPNVPPGVWWVPDGNHLGFRVLCERGPRR